MNIGAHVSAAGDMSLAPERAQEMGCECFQFFSRSPQGGKAKEITPELAEKFKTAMKDNSQKASYIHAPYYINFASANKRIYHGSISVIRDELERGSLLGVDSIMFHPGSYKDMGEEKGVELVRKGLAKVMAGYKGSTQLLFEISAGAGAIIGATFEGVSSVLDSKELKKYDIGICFDTAHAFASGYDLATEKAVKNTFKEFDRVLGLDRLILIHANDSKVELDAKRDRHEHIGQGYIGKAGFQAVVDFAKRKKIDLVLETPFGDERLKDIKLLKKMRDKK
jgi:deoxyribonuclease-4